MYIHTCIYVHTYYVHLHVYTCTYERQFSVSCETTLVALWFKVILMGRFWLRMCCWLVFQFASVEPLWNSLDNPVHVPYPFLYLPICIYMYMYISVSSFFLFLFLILSFVHGGVLYKWLFIYICIYISLKVNVLFFAD